MVSVPWSITSTTPRSKKHHPRPGGGRVAWSEPGEWALALDLICHFSADYNRLKGKDQFGITWRYPIKVRVGPRFQSRRGVLSRRTLPAPGRVLHQSLRRPPRRPRNFLVSRSHQQIRAVLQYRPGDRTPPWQHRGQLQLGERGFHRLERGGDADQGGRAGDLPLCLRRDVVFLLGDG